ncbi:MAG: hypothetical protein BWX92_04043 [Deltaproteobacteria bacterium ADurb.Bin135]|nr:MAG: hypothetical protein BWX92_04043 [Deltaproteobacteria bacterium ADurb.Bin135]
MNQLVGVHFRFLTPDTFIMITERKKYRLFFQPKLSPILSIQLVSVASVFTLLEEPVVHTGESMKNRLGTEIIVLNIPD